MFCENCGKEIKNTENFCPYCGAENKINRASSSQNILGDLATRGSNKKKKQGIIAIIIFAIIVGIAMFKCSSKEEMLSFNLQVVNNTGIDIYALYASEPDVDNWEEDLLHENIFYAGDRFNIEFIITEDNLDWDFAIEDVEGNILEFYGLSFAECDVNGATLILEYDGYEATATLY